MEKPYDYYFHDWYLISGSTVQPENIYFSILKVTDQVWESQKKKKKKIRITTGHM